MDNNTLHECEKETNLLSGTCKIKLTENYNVEARNRSVCGPLTTVKCFNQISQTGN